MAHKRAANSRSRPAGGETGEAGPGEKALDLSALTEITGYPLRRAQLAVFDDFNRRFASSSASHGGNRAQRSPIVSSIHLSSFAPFSRRSGPKRSRPKNSSARLSKAGAAD